MAKQIVQVRLEPEQVEQMEKVKRERGWTVSWQIREAIRLYLQTVKK